MFKTKKSIGFWLLTGIGVTVLVIVLSVLIISTIQALRIRDSGSSLSNLSGQDLAARALVQQQNDDLIGAEASLQEALVRETNINYQSQLAVIKYRLKKYDESIQLFQAMVDANQQVAFAWNGTGNAYRDWSEQSSEGLKLDREEQAVNAYKKAIESDPGFASAYINQAIFLNDLERTQEAIEVAKAGAATTDRQELKDLIKRLSPGT